MAIDRSAAKSSDGVRFKAVFEVELVVDANLATDQSVADDLIQAAQDVLGHTGAVVLDVVDQTLEAQP